VKPIRATRSSDGMMRKDSEIIRFEDKISAKEFAHFREDFVTMTILCYLEENVEKYHLVPPKRA